MRLRQLSLLLALVACKGPDTAPKAPEAAPVAVPTTSPAADIPRAPEASPADFTAILSKYRGLALEACTCKAADCYERLRAKVEAELAFDRPRVAPGADETALKAVLETLYGCEPKLPPIVAAGPRPGAPEPSEAAAPPKPPPQLTKPEPTAPETARPEAAKPEAAKPPAPLPEAPKPPAPVPEAPKPHAPPAEAPKPPPGDPLAELPSVPGGELILDMATRLGVNRMTHVFGATMPELRAAVPECRRDEESDLRPYVTSCSWKTAKKDPKGRSVRVVASFYNDRLHQLAVQLGQDHADILRRVDAAFGARAPVQPKPGEDGLGTTSTLWRPTRVTALKVRERRGHRTLVVADGTRYDDFRQRDDAAARAERLNGEAVALSFQYPRAQHIETAEKKLRAALALVPAYRLAHLHLCQLLWLGRGDFVAATQACKEAEKSKVGTIVADALLQQGLIAMSQARHADGRKLLGRVVKTEARGDQPKSRAARLLALHEGTATKKQVEGVISEIACARADGDEPRAGRLIKATGTSERQLARIATSLGIPEQSLTARDLGLCPKPPE